MGISNADKQRRHRQKLKTLGLVHVQGWVTLVQARAIRAIMAGESVTYNPLAPLPAEKQVAARPKLRKGRRDGEWLVLVDDQEIGEVRKTHYAAFAGVPAFDQWRAERKGSVLDALSDRTYKTRAAAVKALLLP